MERKHRRDLWENAAFSLAAAFSAWLYSWFHLHGDQVPTTSKHLERTLSTVKNILYSLCQLQFWRATVTAYPFNAPVSSAVS